MITAAQKKALTAAGYTVKGNTVQNKSGGTVGGYNKNGNIFSGSSTVRDILKSKPEAAKPAAKKTATKVPTTRPKARPEAPTAKSIETPKVTTTTLKDNSKMRDRARTAAGIKKMAKSALGTRGAEIDTSNPRLLRTPSRIKPIKLVDPNAKMAKGGMVKGKKKC